jgi:hypothetical protein
VQLEQLNETSTSISSDSSTVSGRLEIDNDWVAAKILPGQSRQKNKKR